MKRFALIENGTVANVILVPDEQTPGPNQVDVTELRVGPGDAYDNGVFTEASAGSWALDTALATARKIYLHLPVEVRVEFCATLSAIRDLANLKDVAGIQHLLSTVQPVPGYEAELAEVVALFEGVSDEAN